jgi:hypothetical protein
MATPKERNTLARPMLKSVEIKDDRIVAVVPQPDFAPFFVAQIARYADSAESSALSNEVPCWRKRRASVAQLHTPTRCNLDYRDAVPPISRHHSAGVHHASAQADPGARGRHPSTLRGR